MAQPSKPATDCHLWIKVAVGTAEAMESRGLGHAELGLQANADCHFAGSAVAPAVPAGTAVGTHLPGNSPSLHTTEPASVASGERGERQPRVGEADRQGAGAAAAEPEDAAGAGVRDLAGLRTGGRVDRPFSAGASGVPTAVSHGEVFTKMDALVSAGIPVSQNLETPLSRSGRGFVNGHSVAQQKAGVRVPRALTKAHINVHTDVPNG